MNHQSIPPSSLPNLWLGSVSTESHLWIAAEVSLIPISILCHGLVIKKVKWAQSQENIMLT
jgi:hypothetical protein